MSSNCSEISAELSLGLVGPDHAMVPLMAGLSYNCADPYAVQMAFDVGTDEPVKWMLARDLLAAALHGSTGLGDIRAWPSAASCDPDAAATAGQEILNIAMSSPYGQAQFEISARTIEVPLFTLPETTLLLTEPMRHSLLWARDDPRRPRFDAALWGDKGIERVHSEAGGWPHLVQLIAETIIDMLNQGTARHADAALMERALDKAIVSGDTVLRRLLEGECQLPGEWDYISAFRHVDRQPPPPNEAVQRSLRRRLLVVEEADGWKLRVPLMQRWLRARG